MHLNVGRFKLLTQQLCCLHYKLIITVESAKFKTYLKQQSKTTKNTTLLMRQHKKI